MVIKIKLKNTDKYVLLDHEVFEALENVPFFKEHHVLEHVREHSSGVPVFQKYVSSEGGKLKVESIYLAHFIAKKYIPKPDYDKRMFLSFMNGDKLDLRLKNLKWEDMAMVSRKRLGNNKTGFKGVRKTPQDKFVAMISDGEKPLYLGTFDTAEEAALAYNNKSTELFGETSNMNPVDESGKPIPVNEPEQKTRTKKRRQHDAEHAHRHKHENQATNSLEIDIVNLLPVHFEPLKKRGRKPKFKVEGNPETLSRISEPQIENIEELVPQEHVHQ